MTSEERRSLTPRGNRAVLSDRSTHIRRVGCKVAAAALSLAMIASPPAIAASAAALPRPANVAGTSLPALGRTFGVQLDGDEPLERVTNKRRKCKAEDVPLAVELRGGDPCAVCD